MLIKGKVMIKAQWSNPSNNNKKLHFKVSVNLEPCAESSQTLRQHSVCHMADWRHTLC